MKTRLAIESPIPIANNGIVIKVGSNDGNHVGDLQVGRATVQWRKAHARVGKIKKIKIEKLIEFLDSQP